MERIDAFANHALKGFAGYTHQQLNIIPDKNYRFVRIKNSPRVLSFYILVNPSYLKPLLQMEQELSMAMGLESKYTARIRRHQGRVLRVEIPKPSDLCFSIRDTDLPCRLHKAAVGSDLDGRSVFVDLSQPLQAHILIAGQTGSGKTVLQRNVVVALCRANETYQMEFCVVDVSKHGLKWHDLNGKAHLLHPVVVDEIEAVRVVSWFVKELDVRSEKGLVPPAAPRFVLVVDEFADLVDSYVGPAIIPQLAKLTQVGREYGIHCVVSTQHPTMEALGSSMAKRQFGVRFVGRVDDGKAAYIASGVEDSGAQYLSGAGDFIVVKEDMLTRFQVAVPTSGSVDKLPTLEGRQLDLSGIEDPNLILRATRVGRPEDPLDMTIIGRYLGKLSERGMPESMHTAGSWIVPRIAASKAERHVKAANLALGALQEDGFEVLRMRPERKV